MASKRRKRKKECTNKIRHSTQDEAYKALRSFIRSGETKYKIHVYKCGFCNGWHLGAISPTWRGL